MCSRLLIAAPAVLLLAACHTGPIGTEAPGLGETVRYNAALQTINPTPVYPEDGAQPGDNGDKGAQAVKRYRRDATKAVQPLDTTSGGGSPQ